MEHNNGSQQTTASLPACVKVVGDSHARTVAPPGRTNKHNESRTIDTRKDSIVRQFKGGFETRPSTIQECVESNPEGKTVFDVTLPEMRGRLHGTLGNLHISKTLALSICLW